MEKYGFLRFRQSDVGIAECEVKMSFETYSGPRKRREDQALKVCVFRFYSTH